MIKQLKLSNFAKHKSLEINFEKGLTTITGANGAGKSTVSEAIEFALFGIQALRGDKADYSSDLSTTLVLTIRGKEYRIVRTLSNCTINDSVFGTKECNAFLSATLGFGREVYEFANYAKQFSLTALTDCAPVERKKMIDELVGTEKIDKEIKELKSIVNSNEKAIKLAKEVLGTEPLAPIPPVGRSEDEIRKAVEAKRNLESEAKSLEKTMEKEKSDLREVCPSKKPTEEKPCFTEEELANSRSLLQEAKMNAFQRMLVLNELSNLPENAKYTSEELDEEERRLKISASLPKVPRPNFGIEYLAEQNAKFYNHKDWENSKSYACPKCGEVFKLSEEPPKAELTKEELDKQMSRHRAWKNLPEGVENTPSPKLSENEIQKERKLLLASERKRLLLNQLAEIKEISGTEGLEEKIALFEKWKEWENENALFELISSRIAEGEARVAELKTKICEFPSEETLENELNAWTNYHVQSQIYSSEKTRYEAQKVKIETLEKDVEKYGLALSGLTEYKKRIKTYVIPSLKQVASSIIREMSSGELDSFDITEDFDITLDGKKICLLSGSEKALANIALRLSLGRVLTKGVLSLFIADEIDASMSEERAVAVQDSLLRLASRISQIFVITHKNLEGDHTVAL